jgi:transcriptional regulator with XRE-family HTH domain
MSHNVRVSSRTSHVATFPCGETRDTICHVEKFPDRLRRLLAERKVSVRAFAQDYAELIGTKPESGRRTINRWLAGKVPKPNRTSVTQAERALGVPAGTLEETIDRTQTEYQALQEELAAVWDAVRDLEQRLAPGNQDSSKGR